MSESKPLLTAAGLMTLRPSFVDVPCEAWGGTVRLARMDGPDKIRFAIASEQLERDEAGKIKLLSPVNWAFAVDLLAASIVDGDGQLQFADPSARAWLSGEIRAVGELMPRCMILQGLGAATPDDSDGEARNELDEVEEAKKN